MKKAVVVSAAALILTFGTGQAQAAGCLEPQSALSPVTLPGITRLLGRLLAARSVTT